MNKHQPPPMMVIVKLPEHTDHIAGFNAVEGHLPRVLRFPGEPIKGFMNRALAMATGRGAFAVTCIIREVPHAMAR
mgnify:CR=1 FL=1